jgi:hypothetical protein
MDKDDLIPVWSVPTAVQAEMIKNFLGGAGIKCAVEGENQGGWAGALPIRLLVRAWDAEHAKKLLEKEGF